MPIFETVTAVVGATAATIAVIKAGVEWAERSCVIEVDDMSAETLELTRQGHESTATLR